MFSVDGGQYSDSLCKEIMSQGSGSVFREVVGQGNGNIFIPLLSR